MRQSFPWGRRSFVWKAGAALSATAASVFAASPERTPGDEDLSKARLARLEDVHAIRALHESHARLLQERDGVLLQKLIHQPDVIEIAPDRRTATARFPCVVHSETAIGPACPLVEMAVQQGGGVIKCVETGIFENVYAREGAAWKIRQLAYRAETPRSTPFTFTYPGHPGGPDRLPT